MNFLNFHTPSPFGDSPYLKGRVIFAVLKLRLIIEGEFCFTAPKNFAPNIGEMSAGQRGITIPTPQAVISAA